MAHIDGGKLELYPDQANPYLAIQSEVDIHQLLAEDKGLIFTAFIDESLKQDIHIDIARFKQCLHSLLCNAVKFTQKGRIHLHVTTRLDENENIHIQSVIADTGQGITDEVQARLFTPFLQADSSMTRKHGGAGLNLAITRALARMMDGDVTLVSKAGRGSEFTFTVTAKLAQDIKPAQNESFAQDVEDVQDNETLIEPQQQESRLQDPLEEAPMAEAALAPQDEGSNARYKNAPHENTLYEADMPENILDLMQPNHAMNHAGLHQDGPQSIDENLAAEIDSTPEKPQDLTVLITEDMATNRDIIRLFLEPAGYICLEAENGQEALDILKTHHIDIILMDLRMPVMDGIEATKIIRASNQDYKDIPIIALTADSTSEVNTECLSIGMDIFLAKPVIAADLTQSISFLLRQRNHTQFRALAAG